MYDVTKPIVIQKKMRFQILDDSNFLTFSKKKIEIFLVIRYGSNKALFFGALRLCENWEIQYKFLRYFELTNVGSARKCENLHAQKLVQII